jgi:hypothetical protein
MVAQEVLMQKSFTANQIQERKMVKYLKKNEAYS